MKVAYLCFTPHDSFSIILSRRKFLRLKSKDNNVHPSNAIIIDE